MTQLQLTYLKSNLFKALEKVNSEQEQFKYGFDHDASTEDVWITQEESGNKTVFLYRISQKADDLKQCNLAFTLGEKTENSRFIKFSDEYSTLGDCSSVDDILMRLG